MVNAYIKAVQNCENYENGNILAKMLVSIDKLSSHNNYIIMCAVEKTFCLCVIFSFSPKNQFQARIHMSL